MQIVKKQWLALGLALGTLVSCSQDSSEPNSSDQVRRGETVSFSLNAEVSVDDPSLRAIDYKLGNNANGELVPMPQFTEGQEVEVHTILKSSNGASVAKTLKWRYDASKKKLVLKRNDGHSITVSGFNNDAGVKWYVSGLIGGVLIDGTTRVSFAGERVLKGVEGNAGDIVGSLKVPYAFGWTELSIDTSSARDTDDSHKYASVSPSVGVKFSPRGALIAYKLGNAQTAGSYTFSPTGFTVNSNVWGDQGEFELDTTIPASNPEGTMPIWSESASCGKTIYYTFAGGHEPSAIAHNSLAGKTYYAWVIPHEEQPTTSEVRVMLKGASSRPETATYKDYTKTYFTDYAPKATGAQGKVSHGRVHRLTAKATDRLVLPIEYVTEYNLAGGDGLTATITLPNQFNPDLTIQPDGTQGALRFASSHSNDQSGYYNWYKRAGVHDATYNPNTLDLSAATLIDTDGSSVALNSKYFVPTQEDWWGVFPSFFPVSMDDDYNPTPIRHENLALRVGDNLVRQSFLGKVRPYESVERNESGDIVMSASYAIRFTDRKCSYPEPNPEFRDQISYPSASGDVLKCAYRYRRIGSRQYWAYADSWTNNTNMTNHYVIDVVYLGEEDTPSSLDTISDEIWWEAKEREGAVISRIFPASGIVVDRTGRGTFALSSRGRSSALGSTSFLNASLSRNVLGNYINIQTEYYTEKSVAVPIRLFYRSIK